MDLLIVTTCGIDYLIDSMCGNLRHVIEDTDNYDAVIRKEVLNQRRKRYIDSDLARKLYNHRDWLEMRNPDPERPLIALHLRGLIITSGTTFVGRISTFLWYQIPTTCACMNDSVSSFKPSSGKSPQASSDNHRGLMKTPFSASDNYCI